MGMPKRVKYQECPYCKENDWLQIEEHRFACLGCYRRGWTKQFRKETIRIIEEYLKQ